MNNRRLLVASLFPLMAAPVLGNAATRTVYPITRHRFGIVNDWVVPKVKTVKLLPMTKVVFQDNGDFTLQPDGLIRVNTTGLYMLHLGVDWKAQEGLDIDRRMIGLRRKLASDTTAPNLQDQRIGSIDTPASDSPRCGRGTINMEELQLAAGQAVTFDMGVVSTSNGPAGMLPGDMVQVAHTGVNDAILLTARVIGPDFVRVVLRNMSPVTEIVAPGVIRVLVQSASERRGESNDAWNVLGSPLEELQAGDRVYACVRVIVENDYVQATDTTFIQIERFA